jgi:signal transduction histidine kinase
LRIIRLPGGRPLCLSRQRTWTPSAAAGPGGRVRLEAVALGGPVSLVDDAGRMASELVASAIRHTDAPVELTVDAGDDMVRIEVRDDDASLPGSGRVVSFELREASTAV